MDTSQHGPVDEPVPERRCSRCKVLVPEDSDLCPDCGVPVKRPARSRWMMIPVVAVTLLAVVAVGLLVTKALRDAEPASRPVEQVTKPALGH